MVNLVYAQTRFAHSIDMFGDADAGFSLNLENDTITVAVASFCNSNTVECPGFLIVDTSGNILHKTQDMPYSLSLGGDVLMRSGHYYYTTGDGQDEDGSWRFFLMKSKSSGERIWTKFYGNPDSVGVNISAVKFSDNLFVSAGTYRSDRDNWHMHIVGLNSNGNVLWQNEFGQEYPRCSPNKVIALDNGKIAIGFDYGWGPAETAGIIVLDSLGREVWRKVYNTAGIGARVNVTSLEDSKMAISWIKDTFTGPFEYQFPPIIYGLDSLGNVNWSYTFYSRWQKQIISMFMAKNGDIVGVGANSKNILPNDEIESAWIFRMTNQGQLLWERTFARTPADILPGFFWDAEELSNEDIVVTGVVIDTPQIGSSLPADANVWLLRLGPDGCLQNDGCEGNIILNLKNPKFKIQQIHTFPNPIKDRIFANLNCRHDFEVRAMDQLGHTVILDYSCDGNFISVNTEQLTPGIYTVLFSYIKRNERYYAKVIKTP